MSTTTTLGLREIDRDYSVRIQDRGSSYTQWVPVRSPDGARAMEAAEADWPDWRAIDYRPARSTT